MLILISSLLQRVGPRVDSGLLFKPLHRELWLQSARVSGEDSLVPIRGEEWDFPVHLKNAHIDL